MSDEELAGIFERCLSAGDELCTVARRITDEQSRNMPRTFEACAKILDALAELVEARMAESTLRRHSSAGAMN